ncbi:ligase-associated DNA damage response endonuclease PdeM, partial [Thioclava sp. BHET1]
MSPPVSPPVSPPDASYAFTLAGAALWLLPSGALYWPEARLLTVSDLHLGKSERLARRGGALLPPYEVQDTLARLDADLEHVKPATVICLGDTFDDAAAEQALPSEAQLWLARMMAGRRWIWIAGNHDPGPVGLGGSHLAEIGIGPLSFRHIARPEAQAEISGHYHPKARLRRAGASIARPCALIDSRRLILPAYGSYTGGLSTTDPA